MVCEMASEVRKNYYFSQSSDSGNNLSNGADGVSNVLDLTCPNKSENQSSHVTLSSQGITMPTRGPITTQAGLTKGDKTFTCGYNLCMYQTKYKNAMKRHVETQHLTLAQHSCPVCQKCFKHQDNLSKHRKIHKKDEKCTLCNRAFALKQQLRHHLKNKHRVDPDIYFKNNAKQGVRPDAFQTSLDIFVEECTKVCKTMYYKRKATALTTAEQMTNMTEDPTEDPTETTETKASDMSTISSMSPSEALQDSHSTSSSHLVTSTISQSIVREAVLQNPNLSMKQDVADQDDFIGEFSSDIEAMQASSPLNLSLSQIVPLCSLAASRQALAQEPTSEPVPEDNMSLRKLLECSVCPYKTGNKGHMKRHALTVHSDTKPYACYVCEQGFTRTEKIRRHFARVHPEEVYNGQRLKIQTAETTVEISDSSSSSAPSPTPSLSRTASPQVTSSCNNLNDGDVSQCSMSKEEVAGEHEKTAICGLINPQRAFVHYDYSATFCNGEDHSDNHIIQTPGELKCLHCSFSTTDLEGYMYHLRGCMRNQNNGHASLVCDYCQDTVAQPTDMVNHLLNVHGIEVFQCEFCTHYTDSRDSFLYHYDCHQNGLTSSQSFNLSRSQSIEIYSCSLCAFQTKYRFIMTHHIGFHTGNAKQCGVKDCSFESMLSLSLEVHRQFHHGQVHHDSDIYSNQNGFDHFREEFNSYRCGSCFLTFNSLTNLQQHLSNCEMGKLERSVYGSDVV